MILCTCGLTRVYAMVGWVKAKGAGSALVRATLSTEGSTLNCIGTVLARSGCWSFLKGGFVLDSFSRSSILYLQPESLMRRHALWQRRKRAVTIHVSDEQGNLVSGASVSIQQLSRDFPFGSAIANTILGNKQYQVLQISKLCLSFIK
ncbi:hypothetical protein B296_00046161 [Ensete ventricosum]|uniref:Uncharacterized protein n=1 Tax=Ensete ventricosum TaxID=4639 RepID=A0A426XLW3_ENSVE|nr:hypothetical protein B296_00046161 [Ensete ventricosum]